MNSIRSGFVKKLICFLLILCLLPIPVLGAGESAAVTIASPSAVLMHPSGEILYQKNPGDVREIASVTKIMTLLLAAEALGLGAVWTAASDEERSAVVRNVLGIPAGVSPFCVIPIGFPAETTFPKDKWAPEKIHYDKW